MVTGLANVEHQSKILAEVTALTIPEQKFSQSKNLISIALYTLLHYPMCRGPATYKRHNIYTIQSWFTRNMLENTSRFYLSELTLRDLGLLPPNFTNPTSQQNVARTVRPWRENFWTSPSFWGQHQQWSTPQSQFHIIGKEGLNRTFNTKWGQISIPIGPTGIPWVERCMYSSIRQ